MIGITFNGETWEYKGQEFDSMYEAEGQFWIDADTGYDELKDDEFHLAGGN